MLAKFLQRLLPVVARAALGKRYICLLAKAEETLLISLSPGVTSFQYMFYTLSSRGSGYTTFPDMYGPCLL